MIIKNMKRLLNSNHLKLIAIIAMTIDHGADLLYPGFPLEAGAIVLHFIGRITAPIMWFFICEGYHYTKDAKKYMMRLGVFALISHFAYCFCFGISLNPFTGSIFNRTSVMYPLFIAVVVLYLEDNWKADIWLLKRGVITILILSTFPADWSCIAVLAILWMYDKRGNLEKQMIGMLGWVAVYGIVSFLFVSKVYAIELVGVLTVYPILKLYNGTRGNARFMKWIFYIYYPLHLFIIGLIRIYVYGNINICI